MSDRHVPDPEFVARLEGEIRGAVRRREAFGGAAGPRRRSSAARWGFAGAALVVAMLLGASGVLLAQELQGASERDLHRLSAEVQLELAQAEEQDAQTRLGEVERLHEASAASEEELARARMELAEARAERERRVLDLLETRETGEPPRRDLTAPRPGGRDFVTERLRIDLDLATRRTTECEQACARLEALGQAGMVSEDDREHTGTELKVAQSRKWIVAQRLELRRAFVAGKLERRRVELLAMQAEVRATTQIADARLAEVRKKLQTSRALAEAGIASSQSVWELQTTVKRLEAEARLEAIRAALLTKRLAAQR